MHVTLYLYTVQWHFCATHVVFANVFAFVASHSSFELDWCRPRLQRNEKYHFHHRRFPRQNVISNWELMRSFGMSSGLTILDGANTEHREIATCFNMRCTHSHPASSQSNEDDATTHKKVVNFLIHTMGNRKYDTRNERTDVEPVRMAKPAQKYKIQISITYNGNEYPKPIQLSNKISYQFFIVLYSHTHTRSQHTTISIRCASGKRQAQRRKYIKKERKKKSVSLSCHMKQTHTVCVRERVCGRRRRRLRLHHDEWNVLVTVWMSR